jgi:transposase
VDTDALPGETGKMKERRTYSDELKAEAVRMITREGLPQSEVGKKLGIPKGTIGKWLSNFKDEDVATIPGAPSVRELLAENSKLRKELAEAKMKEEILKKAATYFAKESFPSMRS